MRARLRTRHTASPATAVAASARGARRRQAEAPSATRAGLPSPRPLLWEKRQRPRTGRGPGAGHTIGFKRNGREGAGTAISPCARQRRRRASRAPRRPRTAGTGFKMALDARMHPLRTRPGRVCFFNFYRAGRVGDASATVPRLGRCHPPCHARLRAGSILTLQGRHRLG
eukprot:gene24003-biopygen4380